jgi:hypothetical protein
MRPRRRRTLAVGLAVGGAVVASATAVYAIGLEPDGLNLGADWTTGGEASLELEDRNVEPVICFIWDNDAPQDGDSFSSRILTRAGAQVVDLGKSDQWVDGSGQGCEIPRDDRYRDVFANPGRYVVEFTVIENQGTAPTPAVRSQPLQAATE